MEDHQRVYEEFIVPFLSNKFFFHYRTKKTSRSFKTVLIEKSEYMKFVHETITNKEINETTLQGIANHTVSKNDIEHSFSNSSKYRRHPINSRKKIKNKKEQTENSLARALKIAKYRDKYNIEQDSAKNEIRKSLEQ